MNIIDLINSEANVQIVVNALDLKEAFFAWSEEYKEKTNKDQDTTPDGYNDFLTLDEAREKLGVTAPTLWRWDKTGYLKKMKIGQKVLYRMSDINRVLEG